MFISDLAIRRPILTIVVMVALVVFGLFALLRLETDELPDIEAPIVQLAIAYPGASPETVEREVVDRIENQIQGISGVDKIESTSLDGFALITVTFLFSKDIQQAEQDVRDAISAIRGDLPPEMREPILRRFDPDQLPIVSLTLSAPGLDLAQLTRLADPGITGVLQGVEGVAQVNVVGADSSELTVRLRPADLEAAGVGAADVVQAVEAQNLAAPVGRLNTSLSESTIRLRGRIENPQDFGQLVVAQRGGQLIRLNQVADVLAGTAELRTLALYNEREAIGLDIVKAKGFSTEQVANAVLDRVAQVRKTLPAGATLDVVQNAGERVHNSVRNVEDALVEGALLTVLVVFIFLNSWRSTVITGLALPVSVLASFIAVWAFGFTLNTMSLLGLSLAIGILIDDAIVVRENIVRHIEMGEDHMHASRTATSEIGLAVTATTLSIMAVFLPVAFMSGISGQWFKPFALTIACAVLVSLFVSFSLDPMLSAYWPDPQLEEHQRANWLSRTLDRFQTWIDRQADRYRRLIAWALDHRWWVMLIAALTFVGSLVLQALLGGVGFVPVSDQSEMNISIETPPGSSLRYTRIKADEIDRILRAHPEVKYTYTTIGSASGSGAVDAGNVYVRLVAKDERDISQDEFSRVIRAELRRLGGVTAWVFSSGFGGNQKQIQLQLHGPDISRLDQLAAQIEDTVRQVPGAVDVGLSTKGERPEVQVTVRRGLAGSLGLTVAQIATALRAAFAGVQAGYWVDPSGQTRNVTVRLAPGARENVADLRRLPLVVAAAPTAPPRLVTLGDVADVELSIAPAEIDHLGRERVITIGANVEGAPLGRVSAAINERISSIPMPAGYGISQGGEVESQGEVFGAVAAALGLAVLFMYLILVVQFGSFLDPVATMLSLPLSFIGVVLALIVTRDTINIMSLIGVVLLMGIVVKNAILLIDFAKWAKERQGMNTRDALIEAGRIRLRPIMMTTLALIAGMVPVALGIGEGADFRAPLGRAVIGGVITSTLLTLLVVPTVYEILDAWRAALLGWFGRNHARDRAPHPAPEPGD
jgi:HAE1 family hydrophobic/amphiphilic exporter-1